MENNTDLMISNLINIYKDSELKSEFNGEELMLMKKAIQVYAVKVATKYYEDYQREVEKTQVMSEFKSYEEQGHPKLGGF